MEEADDLALVVGGDGGQAAGVSGPADLPQRGRLAGGVAIDALERLVGVAPHPADEQDAARSDPRHQVGEIGRRRVV
jgi:hypothetical protein